MLRVAVSVTPWYVPFDVSVQMLAEEGVTERDRGLLPPPQFSSKVLAATKLEIHSNVRIMAAYHNIKC